MLCGVTTVTGEWGEGQRSSKLYKYLSRGFSYIFQTYTEANTAYLYLTWCSGTRRDGGFWVTGDPEGPRVALWSHSVRPGVHLEREADWHWPKDQVGASTRQRGSVA